jgi:iron(III) transport system ATP-binding protein
MISVTIEDLTKRFGDTTALDRVNLRIEPGEVFFLLGPSGCGKTTLLRHIAGFYVPDSGRVLFDDEDVSQLPPHRRNTGMMFQSYALWPHMTVAGNVAFGLEERKVRRPEIQRRVAEALASVRMEGYADRKIHQLSGGQQQRVALARAMVIRPRCILLDEPLSNLDAKLRLEMRGEIRRVCKESGLTAIYVTHDQKEALSISDRMAVLDRGRVAQVGSPREVYRRPRTTLVADFIGETNFIDGVIEGPGAGQETLRVRTATGLFEGVLGDPSWVPDRAGSVTLSIRPECWQLGGNATGTNALAGTVGEAVYLGESAQYQLATSAGPIRIIETNPRSVGLVPGAELRATAAADDVVILPPR